MECLRSLETRAQLFRFLVQCFSHQRLSPICGVPSGYKGIESIRHPILQHGTYWWSDKQDMYAWSDNITGICDGHHLYETEEGEISLLVGQGSFQRSWDYRRAMKVVCGLDGRRGRPV